MKPQRPKRFVTRFLHYAKDADATAKQMLAAGAKTVTRTGSSGSWRVRALMDSTTLTKFLVREAEVESKNH